MAESNLLPFNLRPLLTSGSKISETGARAWRLEIPAGPQGKYRVAQLDNYGARSRKRFPWQSPLQMKLRARASAEIIPGTWGFGLWNDPFSMALLRGTEVARFPALPNAAWFFFASPPNYLSLRDNLPAQGWLAATFCSIPWSAPFLAAGVLALPLLAIRSTARWLRRQAQRIVQQDAVQIPVSVKDWHAYHLDWQSGKVIFKLDGETLLETDVSPVGPLGMVLWMDNQYAAFPPEGRFRFGTLANLEPVWVEVSELAVSF